MPYHGSRHEAPEVGHVIPYSRMVHGAKKPGDSEHLMSCLRPTGCLLKNTLKPRGHFMHSGPVDLPVLLD